jgi:hypothetical protein
MSSSAAPVNNSNLPNGKMPPVAKRLENNTTIEFTFTDGRVITLDDGETFTLKQIVLKEEPFFEYDRDFLNRRKEAFIAKYSSDIAGLKLGFAELFKDEEYIKLKGLRAVQAKLDKINHPTDKDLDTMATIRGLIKRSELELSKLAGAKGGRRRHRKSHKRRKSHRRKSRKN